MRAIINVRQLLLSRAGGTKGASSDICVPSSMEYRMIELGLVGYMP